MIRPRSIVTSALCAVAGLFLLIALIMRGPAVPPQEANYTPAPVVFKASAKRPATAGVTYAIDSIEVDGIQHPIADSAPLRANGPIIVHGWAVLPGTLSPAAHLLVSIDGRSAAIVGNYGQPRPDVGAAVNPAATNSGFAESIDPATLKPGRHTVRFFLEDASGARTVLPTVASFVLAAP